MGSHHRPAAERRASLYTRLNAILDQADFDGHVETLCQRFYADDAGRPGLPPGRYFRMLLLGYFEGLDSERAPKRKTVKKRGPKEERLIITEDPKDALARLLRKPAR